MVPVSILHADGKALPSRSLTWCNPHWAYASRAIVISASLIISENPFSFRDLLFDSEDVHVYHRVTMSYSFSSLFCICFLILSFCQPLTAGKSSSVSNAFESPYNNKIKCYALPYGGFGFASHILTYYAMTMICCGRRPLAPWTRLRGPRKWNLSLAIIKLIFTIIPSVVTMVR